MNTYDAAHALAKALRESSDYKEFREAQLALKADPSARKMLLDFRLEQFNLQKQKLSGLELAPEQEEKLAKLFEIIGMNNIIKRFLQAEYRIAVILQDVHKIIGEAADEVFDPELLNLPVEELDEKA
ncbi:MAG TPA: YlbF family regulator [Candidatus Limnocylindrales bacterium]|nr:YlbF family regulator [Candidatus Limnocylindrales bacterium]